MREQSRIPRDDAPERGSIGESDDMQRRACKIRGKDLPGARAKRGKRCGEFRKRFYGKDNVARGYRFVQDIDE